MGQLILKRRLIDPCYQTPDRDKINGEISNKTSQSNHDAHQRYDICNTPTHLEIGTKNPYKDEASKKNGNNTRNFIVFLAVHHKAPCRSVILASNDCVISLTNYRGFMIAHTRDFFHQITIGLGCEGIARAAVHSARLSYWGVGHIGSFLRKTPLPILRGTWLMFWFFDT